MSRPREISKKLKGADPELSMYIIELEKENLRLHKRVAKLQAGNVTKDNEIKALKQAQPGIKVVIQKYDSPSQPVTPALPGTPQGNHPAPSAPGEPVQITK